jgi:hypothetical protein
VDVKERIKGLAKLTKDGGGADLWVHFSFFFFLFAMLMIFLLREKALCFEAALNAIQRQYTRLLIEASTETRDHWCWSSGFHDFQSKVLLFDT